MTMTNLETNNVVDETEETTEKPYTFRELGAVDIFLMTPIFSAIGVDKIAESIPQDLLNEMKDALAGKEDGEKENSAISIGMRAVGGIGQTILENLDKCEGPIFKLLSKTSNLTEDQVRRLPLDVFVMMIIDFFKKEEFTDFMKAVSKFAK